MLEKNRIISIIPASGWRAVVEASFTEDPDDLQFIEYPVAFFALVDHERGGHDGTDFPYRIVGVFHTGCDDWCTNLEEEDFVTYLAPGECIEDHEELIEDVAGVMKSSRLAAERNHVVVWDLIEEHPEGLTEAEIGQKTGLAPLVVWRCLSLLECEVAKENGRYVSKDEGERA